MLKQKIAEGGGLTWYVLGRDPDRPQTVIDTNEYAIVDAKGETLLMDPGGTEIFPHVVTALAELVEIQKIRFFFASHQDPDIMSSLPRGWASAPKRIFIYPGSGPGLSLILAMSMSIASFRCLTRVWISPSGAYCCG